MNKVIGWTLGAAAAVVATSAIRKGIAASKGVPKFLTPRNFKIQKWFLTFDLPFRIVNVEPTSYTIQGLGGTLFYEKSKDNLFEFCSFFAPDSITVKPNNTDVYTVQCKTYLPDIIGTLASFVSVIDKPLPFRAVGNVTFFGFTIRYDEPLKITFVSEAVKVIKLVLNTFRKK